MIRQWMEFEGGIRESTRERLHATLNARGLILINRKTFEALGEPKGAALLYDERHQAIGLRPAASGERNFFPIKPKNGVTYRTIYARPFCKHFKIKPTGTLTFPKAELDENGILILDLHSAEDTRRT